MGSDAHALGGSAPLVHLVDSKNKNFLRFSITSNLSARTLNIDENKN
jgi:hypothetical protein